MCFIIFFLCVHVSVNTWWHTNDVLVCRLIFPHLRSHHCLDASFQRLHQCDLPASLGWRLYHQQTSVTSSTPQKRVTGTSSASLTCSWAASQKPSLCSWKPKAPPSLAQPARLQAKGSPLSRYPWSSTLGELVSAWPNQKFDHQRDVVMWDVKQIYMDTACIKMGVSLWFLCLLPFSVMLSYIRRGESHWWMKGSTPPQIAEIIIKLVKDMAAVSSCCLNPSF